MMQVKTMSLGSILQFSLLLTAVVGGFAYSMKDEIKKESLMPKIEHAKVEQTAKNVSGVGIYETISNSMNYKPVDNNITYLQGLEPAPSKK